MALDFTDPDLIAFLKGAAAVGATQNLKEDKRLQVVVIGAVFLCLAAVFVGLRFYARRKQKAEYGDDDWLMVLSLLLLAVNMGVITASVVVGHLGLHSGALTIDQAIILGKLVVVAEVFYVTNINLVKLSLLTMYYRIFPVNSMLIGCYVLGLITMAWNIGTLGMIATQCIPFEKNWYPWMTGQCINLRTTFLAASIPNISTDIAILTLPLPHVWKLHTDLRQKILLSFIFLLGSLVVFASSLRFVVYLNFHPEDTPYTLAMGGALNLVEISSGIVSACMPTLGPLVRGFLGRISSSKISLENSHRTPNIVTIGGGNKRNRKNNFVARQNRSLYSIEDESEFSDSDADLISMRDVHREDINHSIMVTETVTQRCEVGGLNENELDLWHKDEADRRKSWSEGKVKAGSTYGLSRR